MSPAPAAGSLGVSVRHTFLHFSLRQGDRGDDASSGEKKGDDEEQPMVSRSLTEPARPRCSDLSGDSAQLFCDEESASTTDDVSECSEQPLVQREVTMDHFEEPSCFQAYCPCTGAVFATLREPTGPQLSVADCDFQPCLEHNVTFSPFEEASFSQHSSESSVLALPEFFPSSFAAAPLHLPQSSLPQEQQPQHGQRQGQQCQQTQLEQQQAFQELLQMQFQFQQLQLQQGGQLPVTSQFQTSLGVAGFAPGTLVEHSSECFCVQGSSAGVCAPWGATPCPQQQQQEQHHEQEQASQQLQHRQQQQWGGSRIAPAPASAVATAAAPLAGGRTGGAWRRSGAKDPSPEWSTIMLRNLPLEMTRQLLLEAIGKEGFAGSFDFVYLPLDFKTSSATGYAFVNLVSGEEARRFFNHFDGFQRWPVACTLPCSVAWSDPHQGLEANVARYRNSPLFHDRVPDWFRPVLFSGGVRVPFPAPTRRIKEPRKGNERMLV